MQGMDHIKGLFEIHISVNPAQILQLRMFCMKNKVKSILAVAEHGDYPNQLMISSWTTGLSKDAIAKANELAEVMKDQGLEVVRVKVEAMASNFGVPSEPNGDVNPSHYFEFHIQIPVNDHQEWKQIEAVAVSHQCAVSFNAFKDHIKALVTMRISASKGYTQATEMKDQFVASMLKEGIQVGTEIQKEFSVFDTNPAYDAGWLITRS